MDTEARRVYNKAYYEKNKEARIVYQKAYQDKNKEARRVYGKAYHEKNKEARIVYQKAYRDKNKEAKRVYDKAYHEKNKDPEWVKKRSARAQANTAKRKREDPEGYVRSLRHRGVRRKYGLTPEKYQQLFADCNNQCTICKDPVSMYSYEEHKTGQVDHCHTTSKVRGILCGSCNTSLGGFKDDTNLLKAAILYLEESRVED